jgi:transcriptional regulator with XRE-family HTH domain
MQPNSGQISLEKTSNDSTLSPPSQVLAMRIKRYRHRRAMTLEAVCRNTDIVLERLVAIEEGKGLAVRPYEQQRLMVCLGMCKSDLETPKGLELKAEAFGLKVRTARQNHGLSFKDLSRKTSIPPKRVEEIESAFGLRLTTQETIVLTRELSLLQTSSPLEVSKKFKGRPLGCTNTQPKLNTRPPSGPCGVNNRIHKPSLKVCVRLGGPHTQKDHKSLSTQSHTYAL